MNIEALSYRHHSNSRRFDALLSSAAHEASDNLRGWEGAVAEIQSWPGYAATPLWTLNGMAHRVGVSQVHYKDESQRFGRSLASLRSCTRINLLLRLGLGDEPA